MNWRPIVLTGVALLLPVAPREVLVADARPVMAERPAVPVGLDDLDPEVASRGSFDHSLLPKRILRLDGQRVRIRGYMVPTFEPRRLQRFLLSPETKSKPCHFQGDIPVHYIIEISLEDGHVVDYTHEVLAIEGRLVVDPVTDKGTLHWLYRIEDASVRAARRRPGFRNCISTGC